MSVDLKYKDMKRALLIIGLILVFFAGCKKDDILEASKIEMKDTNVERSWTYVNISGEYSYPQALESINVYLSENEDMSDAMVYECILEENKSFYVNIRDLKNSTTYYYCYEYDNGYNKVKSEKESVKTVGRHVVATKDVENITKTTAVFVGSVTNNDSDNKIKERGFCWGYKSHPTVDDFQITNGSSTGTYKCNITGLKANTTYYMRAYAKSDYGIVYGEQKSFKTLQGTGNEDGKIELPTVTTRFVSNITSNSATSGGSVTSNGGGTVTARGICWSETSEPKINNLYSEESSDGTGTGSFTSSLTNLKANTTYYVRAYATNEAGTAYGELKSFVTETISGTENGHDYVDLGLPSGLKWATCNVGATTPEEYGGYYAWGEISTKVTYLTTNSLTYEKNMNDISGNAKYDAATANWGGNWRMPTRDELNELRNNCTWTWTTQNGVNGYKVTSKTNGGSIFMPAAGSKNSSFVGVGERGEYWTSTPSDNDGEAIFLQFEESFYSILECVRSWGQCIRPVFGGNFTGPEEQPEDEPEETISGTENGHNYVDLGLLSGLKWATCNVGATTPEEYGGYYAWGETTTKIEYTEENCLTSGKQMNDISGNAQYDAATANWGGAWRMPTYDELNELNTQCTWTWTTQDGVNGYKVEGPNGNSIFLPAAGHRYGSSLYNAENFGYYWSSTPYENFDYDAYYLYFSSASHDMSSNDRYYGWSVRPVFGGNFEEPEEPETPGTNQTFNVNGVSFTMIAVEGGTFQMGAQCTDSSGDNYDSDAYSYESPVHSVTLSSYYIGETEVTQELWQAVMGSNPSYYSGYPQRPVESVSWNDCQEFITKLNQLTGKNFRLPTEAEWEYAARGGNKSMCYKYSGSNTIENIAWYWDNSSSGTQIVKTKQANELGIYDMSGNVWEWCQDWYGDYSSGSQTNPTGPASGSNRVLRGGSCGGYAGCCRVSYRYDDYPGNGASNFGFRLVL